MALTGLTGFETFSRVLLGWFGRMVTKDSVDLKNQLVKARIPLLPEDYVASSAMQVILAFLGGIAVSLVIVGFLVPQLETMDDPANAGEKFDISNTIQSLAKSDFSSSKIIGGECSTPGITSLICLNNNIQTKVQKNLIFYRSKTFF